MFSFHCSINFCLADQPPKRTNERKLAINLDLAVFAHTFGSGCRPPGSAEGLPSFLLSGPDAEERRDGLLSRVSLYLSNFSVFKGESRGASEESELKLLRSRPVCACCALQDCAKQLVPGCEKSSARLQPAQVGHARLVLSKTVTFSAQRCTCCLSRVMQSFKKTFSLGHTYGFTKRKINFFYASDSLLVHTTSATTAVEKKFSVQIHFTKKNSPAISLNICLSSISSKPCWYHNKEGNKRKMKSLWARFDMRLSDTIPHHRLSPVPCSRRRR